MGMCNWHMHILYVIFGNVCVCAIFYIAFIFIFIFMRIWARAVYVLRKIRPLLARRETQKQSAWAREVLFSVQVRFEMPKIASCSRAATLQYTSGNFDFFSTVPQIEPPP